jgi:uncharacterized protein YukE
MTKRKEGGRKANLIRCYLTDEEYERFCTFARALNVNASELIRREIIYSGMLHVDPSKQLILFTRIGADLGQIRSELSRVHERLTQMGDQDTWPGLFERFETWDKAYHAAQKSLEQAIRMMLNRLDQKGKMI